MVKKFNQIAATIKTLYQNHMKPITISRKLKISKQRVNYWLKTPIEMEQKRRKKLDEKYRKEIISLAESQTKSSMSSRKIAYIMNKKFEEENLDITISKDTVNRYLKKELGKPRKIRKVFHLTKKKKKRGRNFVK